MSDEQPELPESEQSAEGAENRLSVWAKNQTELAEHLGCDRKTIKRWLKSSDPDCPGSMSDGRYNVTLWKLWVDAKGKKVRNIPKSEDKGALERQQIRLRNEKMEIDLAVSRGELLHIDDVCSVLTEMVTAFVSEVRNFKHVLPNAVVGVSVPEATKRIDKESIEALRKLSLGEWAKKKRFWSSVYVHLLGLQRTHNLGDGQNVT